MEAKTIRIGAILQTNRFAVFTDKWRSNREILVPGTKVKVVERPASSLYKCALHPQAEDERFTIVYASELSPIKTKSDQSAEPDRKTGQRQQDEIRDLLALALPYVEEAEKDPAYKPGAVAKLSKRIRNVLTEPVEP